MAAHASTLAWKIPWMEEPGRLQSMGSQRVGHDWATSLLLLNLSIWCEQPSHWKSPWCWERFQAEEEDIRGQDGWMASWMQWTSTWANFRRWWGTEQPGVLQSKRLQRIGHYGETEQQPPRLHLRITTTLSVKSSHFFPSLKETQTDKNKRYDTLSTLTLWAPI